MCILPHEEAVNSIVWRAVLCWLTKYEAVAVWLEGIALILIFAWDRRDANRDHKETVAQLKVAQDQIKLSQNAERAWVMTELGTYYADGRARIAENDMNDAAGRRETTGLTVKLTCRNEGRSPAWIDSVKGYAEIMNNVRELAPVTGHAMQSYGWMGPLAPGKAIERSLDFSCERHARPEQYISIYVVVEYRDIFENKRTTCLGYSTDMDGNFHRQEGLPERNRNT